MATLPCYRTTATVGTTDRSPGEYTTCYNTKDLVSGFLLSYLVNNGEDCASTGKTLNFKIPT